MESYLAHDLFVVLHIFLSFHRCSIAAVRGRCSKPHMQHVVIVLGYLDPFDVRLAEAVGNTARNYPPIPICRIANIFNCSNIEALEVLPIEGEFSDRPCIV